MQIPSCLPVLQYFSDSSLHVPLPGSAKTRLLCTLLTYFFCLCGLLKPLCANLTWPVSQAYISDGFFFQSKYFYLCSVSKDQILEYLLGDCSKFFMPLGTGFPREVMQEVQCTFYAYDKPPQFNEQLFSLLYSVFIDSFEFRDNLRKNAEELSHRQQRCLQRKEPGRTR